MHCLNTSRADTRRGRTVENVFQNIKFPKYILTTRSFDLESDLVVKVGQLGPSGAEIWGIALQSISMCNSALTYSAVPLLHCHVVQIPDNRRPIARPWGVRVI